MLNVDWRSEETTGRGLHLEIQHSTFSNLRFNSRGGDHGTKLHNLKGGKGILNNLAPQAPFMSHANRGWHCLYRCGETPSSVDLWPWLVSRLSVRCCLANSQRISHSMLVAISASQTVAYIPGNRIWYQDDQS